MKKVLGRVFYTLVAIVIAVIIVSAPFFRGQIQ